MTAPTLRKYQEKAIADVRAALRVVKSVVLQAPTGSGKTVLTAHMIRTAANRGLRSIFTVHRIELLSQTSNALWDLDVTHGMIAGNKMMTTDEVQVATIQTLSRRMDRVQQPHMIIVDEAHRATSPSYRKVLDRWPDAWVIGLTATPSRTDGRGLNDIFQALVQGPTVAELTKLKFLAPYRIIAPGHAIDTSGVHSRGGDFVRGELEVVMDQTKILGDAVAHYRRYVAPGTCLVYCVSRNHAHHVTAAYRNAGIDARYVAGDTPKGEREQAIAGFRTGNPPVIVSVDLFGEGLDVPGLNAVQLLRPTQSMGLHLQQCGRVLRPEPGKKHAIILDHVGNSWKHGLPCDLREWTLEGRTKKNGKAEGGGPQLRHCGECFAIFPASLGMTCPVCGFEFTTRGRLPEEEDGELKEIEAEEHRKARLQSRREEGMARGLEELVELARDRGYKAGWAGARHAIREGHQRGTREFYKTMNEAKRLFANGGGE